MEQLLSVGMVVVIAAVFCAALWLSFAAGSRRKTPAPWLPFGGGSTEGDDTSNPQQS